MGDGGGDNKGKVLCVQRSDINLTGPVIPPSHRMMSVSYDTLYSFCTEANLQSPPLSLEANVLQSLVSKNCLFRE